MLRITNRTFILVMFLASVAATGSIIALVGIWNAANDLADIGVLAALTGSWLSVLALAFVSGRRGNWSHAADDN
jgi:hypothetical protein